MALFRSIVTVGGLTMASRVLGFIRDILIAAILGAGMLADVFFVAFKFPNLFRRLFAEGAFNAAFVPLFAGLLEEEGEDGARAFAEQALAVLLWALLIFVAAFELAMPLLMYGFAPGFAATPEKFDLAILLTRVTFPYLLFISLASLMAGVLNSLGRFAAAAATPILLNLCLIGAILGLAPLMASPAHALAWGVAGAGLTQFVWMYVFCARAGMPLRLRRPRLTPTVSRMLKRIVPVAIGAGVYQINLLIDTIIASFLPTGSISYLFFADRVNQLPLGVVGVAVGTALLPLLSRQLRAGQDVQAMDSQNRALEFAFLLTLPAAAALMVIAHPVIAVLFERGAFGPGEVQATAQALSVYAAGLPAYVLVKALAPGFFARGDTVTPVKAGVAALVVNLVLNLALMGPFLHVGIAMATVISSWLNAGLLAVILMRRGHLKIDGRLRSRLPRMAAASVGMAVVLLLAAPGLEGMLAGDLGARATALAALVAGGLGAFAILAQGLGAANLKELKRFKKKNVS
ncbi:MAG TPA: murein biosynthesis integral membrane protein MurJ [Rhodospirillales bacterium]|nr:murein biosynthesis integral membrane protein MurJ [Rhodospirillales bacterium]